MSSTCFHHVRGGLLRRALAGEVVGGTGAAAPILFMGSVIVEDPILGGGEVESREGPDDEQQDPRHRGGVAHVERAKPAQVQVQRVEERRVGWTCLLYTSP